MLKILKAEISYNKASLVLLFALFLMLSKYDFLMFLLAFVMLNTINTIRNKELRERRLALLPVSIASPAISRIMIMALPFLIFTVFTFIVLLIIKAEEWRLIKSWIVVNGLIIMGFSVYFILRDLTLEYFRRIGLTKNIFIKIVFIFIIFMNLLGIYTMLATNADWPNPAGDIIKFFREDFPAYNPFSGEYGSYYFLILSVMLAASTIYTYSKRKSYLE
ncbi:MAG: hypothetical protein GY863_08320 [bacterium]|nr:hypothetical protein [bacterium]